MGRETRTFVDTSPAEASTVVSSVLTLVGLDRFESIAVIGILTQATGGVLDVYLQMFDGVDWIDYIHFPQLAAGSTTLIKWYTATRTLRNATAIATGRNTTPALAADINLGGDFGNRFRVVFVAGASTSAGASQIIRVVGTTGFR